ncbi:uncharacterized protein LOC135711669 [Ochlerotatus camptorhynchus]|uniref:uncharacterized protein LOC135711669 n=1 Tax=Ochlerotatus camptorhynchus TaxID=644619 RepID=UPI0031DA130C
MNQSRPFRKPPDVEEALSSMLWTPYDNNASDSDSSVDDGPAPPVDHLSLTPGRFSNSVTNNNHLQSSSMKRSLSDWNYRSSSDGVKTGSLLYHHGSNRFSYPYYGFHPAATAVGVDGYWNSNNIYTNGYPGPANATTTTMTAATTTIFPVLPPHPMPPPLLDWKQIRSTATGIYHPPVAPMVPTMTTTTSLLPFSLLSMDSIPLTGVGATATMTPSAAYGFCEDDLINSNMTIGVNDTFGDYQVYPITPVAASGGAYLSHPNNMRHQPSSSFAASGYGQSNDSNNNNNNCDDGGGDDYHYDNNDSLCRISAILKPVMRSSRSHSGNVGDLHFSKHQQRPQHSSIETATGSCSAIATSGESYVGCSSNERPKWNEQNISPFNGYHHEHMEGGCEGEAADDERCDGREWQSTTTATPTAGFDRSMFSSVRIVNGETYAYGDLPASERRLIAATDRQTIERISSSSDTNSAHNNNISRSSSRALDNIRGFGRSVRDRFVDIMRLNVPAAPEGSRTSVYIPSSEGTTTVASAANTDSAISHSEGGPRPTLTIQVNCVDTNNEVQNDVVNNVSSGVSIVNCYRETPKSAADGSSENDNGEATEGQFYPSDVNSANLNPTAIDRNPVNISANAEQMVHVSNTVVQSGSNDSNSIESSYNKKNSASNQTTPQYHQMDIDRIEPANSNRTYTSTEAQTDDPPIPIPRGVVPPYVHPHHAAPMLPPPLLLSPPPGSEFSTREHRRRERRERRQARNRMQHVHPMDQPPPPPPTLIRPPPLEIIPDILHSHLPPPYTTLPMGATVLPAPPPILPAVVHPAAVHHRAAAAAAAAAAVGADDCRYSFPIPIMRSSPSERSRKGCCGHWFAGPPLRALIAVVALGGVACALGGAALGATGLAGSPTSHLTAALLMIGVGVILVTVSGAAWRMTAPGAPPCLGLGSTVDLGRCSRRPCGRGGSTPHGLLYPEFQHRPPPPSYQASMQEYRLRLLLLDRDRQSGRMRSTASPPPTYRSNVGSLLRIPLTSRYNTNNANGATSGGSSTSIFGGISGIISGAMGSSTNSINGIATHSPPPTGADLATSTTTLLSDPTGAPPPTYRTIDRRNSSSSLTAATTGDHQVQIQHPLQTSTATTPTGDSSAVEGDVNLINDDQIVPIKTGTGATGRTPSIIKIDDGKSTAATGTATIQPDPTPHKQRNSITREIIESDSNKASENVANKDLVTIVTISGSLEQQQQHLNKSVYGSSAGKVTTKTGGAKGGASQGNRKASSGHL